MKPPIAIRLLILASLLSAIRGIAEEPGGLTFSYTIAPNEHTSAGIYDADGTLVRTLWSNLSQPSGPHAGSWDGKDDAGTAMPSGRRWAVKVLHSAVNYQWDGVIGNTEAEWTTSTKIWDGLAYVPTQLRFAFSSTGIWAATGYSEGTSNLLLLDPHAPNSPRPADPRYFSQNVAFVDIDVDGDNMYLANLAVWSGTNFITKFDLASGQPSTFSTGSSVDGPSSWRGIRMSGIAAGGKETPAPGALAVESDGATLAVAYPTAGRIDFFDKVSGAPQRAPLALASPQSIGFTNKGLWILSSGKIFLLEKPGLGAELSTPLSGLSNPVYVTTNKANNHVFVLDGGHSQQVKEFDEAYRLVRTYGDLGGYTDWNPTITNTRLLLDNTATKGLPSGTGSWLRVSPENELWICDGGNAGRILHLSAKNEYLDQIQFQQETYTLGVIRNQPTRLFRGGIEYAIDYSVPLMPGDPDKGRGGNGSWKMVRNWSVGAEGAHGSKPANYQVLSSGIGGVIDGEQLSNGRVYAHVVDGKSHRYEEVELPLNGKTPMRFIKILSLNMGDLPLQLDGSLMRKVRSGAPPNTTLTLEKSQLRSFDRSNDPVRGPFQAVVSLRYNAETEPSYGDGWSMTEPVGATASGVYPVYATKPYKLDAPHLGGAIAGRSSFLWKTMRETALKSPDLQGSFPAAQGYGGHNGVAVQTVGDNIFASYDGQYAKWGNQHYHYWRDGLMIGQFGEARYDTGHSVPRVAGSAGNIATTRFVKVGEAIYMYMTAEAGYAPVQRWKIAHLDSVFEELGVGVLGESVTLARTK